MTINNNIQETYVSFEVAKLLKKKGFLVEIREYYDKDSVLFYSNYFRDNITVGERKEGFISAPTQQLACDWIRVNFGIHIYTYPVAPFVTEDEDYPKLVWVSKVSSLQQLNFEKFIDADNDLAINHFHTSEEAKEAALLYTLKNLI